MIMNSLSLFHVIFTFFVYLLSNVEHSFGISCKDENNQDVDWFVVYKLPRLETGPKGSLLPKGKAYAYLTSEGPAEWTLSSKGIDDQTSIIGRTWHDFDNKKNSDTASLFYNDDAPEPYTKSAVGHLKGYFAFDTETGFWLAHSIPNFGETDKYQYPHTGMVYGQSAWCITTPTSSLSEICNHLLYCNPNIYERSISDSILQTLDDNAKSLFSDRPNFIREGPFQRESILASLGNATFYTFAKDNQLQEDLYSEILAPSLSISMISETWRNGAGGILPPACEHTFPVTDATTISIATNNFTSSIDHSKWAVATDDSTDPWVCIADLNRMDSQKKRGGGAICFQSRFVWQAYKSIVVETDLCPA